MRYFQFTESHRFTKRAVEMIGEDGIERLQLHLIENPDAGAIIRTSGGIRKVRFGYGGRGRRGGARVIYFFADADGRIFLLDIYSKSEKSDLSKAEIDTLRDQVESWLKAL